MAVYLCVVPAGNNFLVILSNLKDWSTAITVFLILICYQVGWLVNGICFIIPDMVYLRRYKRKLLERRKVDKSYGYIRGVVYQKASPQLLYDLNVDRTVLRLSRTGVLNFSLIGIFVLLIPQINSWISVLPFSLALASISQVVQRSQRYYHELTYVYKEMTKKGDSQTPQE